MIRIMTCEDDEDCLSIITKILSNEGYAVIQASTGEEAFKKIQKLPPDLILLDINLPDTTGIEICKIIKLTKNLKNIPVIMLTSRSKDSDVVVGLESGADDYITKPIQPSVLIARIRTALRRVDSLESIDKNNVVGNISVDPSAKKAYVNKDEIELRAKEFELLNLMIQSPGKVFTREEISQSIWGHEKMCSSRTIDTTIYNLRKKFGREGKRIKSVIPYGYRMEK